MLFRIQHGRFRILRPLRIRICSECARATLRRVIPGPQLNQRRIHDIVTLVFIPLLRGILRVRPFKRRACGANLAAAVLGGFLTRSQTAFTVIPSPHARTVAVPGWVSTELDDWLAAAATGTRR